MTRALTVFVLLALLPLSASAQTTRGQPGATPTGRTAGTPGLSPSQQRWIRDRNARDDVAFLGSLDLWWELHREVLLMPSLRWADTAGKRAAAPLAGGAPLGAEPRVAHAAEITAAAAPALLGYAKHENEEVRSQALLALGRLQIGKGRGLMVRALDNGSVVTRRRAAAGLGLLGDEEAHAVLIARMLDTDMVHRERINATLALGLRPSKAGLEALLKLVRRVGDLPELRAASFLSLGRSIAADEELGVQATKGLRRLATTRHPDGAVRAMAVLALGHMRSAAQSDVLLSALESDQREVREAAAAALARLPLRSALWQRRDALKADIEVLASEGRLSSAHRTVLEDQLARIEIALDRDGTRLRHIEDRVISALVERMRRDPQVEVKRQAALALGRIGSPKAAERLVQEFGRGGISIESRAHFVLALGLAGGQGAAKLAREDFQNERLPATVRGPAALALGLLEEDADLGAVALAATGEEIALATWAWEGYGLLEKVTGKASAHQPGILGTLKFQLVLPAVRGFVLAGRGDVLAALQTRITASPQGEERALGIRALGGIPDASAVRVGLRLATADGVRPEHLADWISAVGRAGEPVLVSPLNVFAQGYDARLEFSVIRDFMIRI